MTVFIPREEKTWKEFTIGHIFLFSSLTRERALLPYTTLIVSTRIYMINGCLKRRSVFIIRMWSKSPLLVIGLFSKHSKKIPEKIVHSITNFLPIEGGGVYVCIVEGNNNNINNVIIVIITTNSSGFFLSLSFLNKTILNVFPWDWQKLNNKSVPFRCNITVYNIVKYRWVIAPSI